MTIYPEPGDRTWKILVVDDDEQVHQVTKLALSRLQVKNIPVTLLTANRVNEAKSILAEQTDLAVVILDVVMEEDTSGLDLVRYIREELKNEAVRIILRTGHPGSAPEIDIIQELDINDYRMKSELTRTKLITLVTTAIRSYDQLHMIQRSTRALESIIQAGNRSFESRDFVSYARSLFSQLPKIIEYLHAAELGFYSSDRDYQILDQYAIQAADFPQDSQGEPGVYFFGPRAVLRFTMGSGRVFVIKIVASTLIDHQSQQLLRVLYSNGSVGFGNLELVTKLQTSAYYDDLTGLPNKVQFLQLIEKRALGASTSWTIGVIDIDDFSELNDTLGHTKGNVLLKKVAERLTTHLVPEIDVCRVSGDTFGFLGPSAKVIPARLLSILDEPFRVGENTYPLRVTIGLTDSEGLLGSEDGIIFANIAMKTAKNRNRGRYMKFTTEMRQTLLHRISLSRDLRPALTDNEFVLFFQPQVEISSQKCIGAESLVRWIRRDGSIVQPGDFIQLAENSGFIHELGRWVFAEACKARVEWATNASIPSDARIGVNISVKQFQDPNFFQFLQHTLSQTGVDPNLIEIEITESFVIQDADLMIANLQKLKNLGMGIAIDDFGTGFSSLNYLLRLPIDKLKIDRSFVMNLMTDSRSVSLTELVINLSKLLGLQVIAEGVESEEQARTLVGLGCDLAQGFLYGRPMNRKNFNAWINQR